MPVIFLLDGGPVHGVSRDPRAEFFVCVLGIHGAVLRANHDGGADRFANTAFVADSSFAWN